MTRIRLCGRPAVEWDGGQLLLPGNQGRLLFAYLVLHRGRPVRRDELLEVLWAGKVAPADADAVLSSPLSRLRKALGAGRLVGRGELSLLLPADAWIDWEAAFDGLRAAQAADSPRAAFAAAVAALEIATAGCCPAWRPTGSTPSGPSWPTCGWSCSSSSRRAGCGSAS